MGKRYSAAYRAEALKLEKEIGRGAAAKKLGISVNSIGTWKKQAQKSVKVANPDTDQIREMVEKIKELEKENARLKKENEFLEEASRFFAAHRQK
jgi:transposase